ncbi:MAG: hypothetical protein E6L09_15390 [Verrucomicrobia bacterium]|nr:MAG: hypothetical protein E6L09_15390 [Verrucomicrobiota bacterium]
MDWLKKNLFLVTGGLVAFGLLGFALFFLFTRKQAVDEVTGQLTAQTEELKNLVNRDPHPNQENIEKARQEQKKLAAFLEQSRRFFVPVASFTNIESAAFKNQLETTISDMLHDADKAGVSLPNAPAKYDFTFKPQRSSVDFAPDTLLPLAMQVAEIKAICDILFAARVQTMVGLRRTPVAKEDEGTTDYLFGRKPTTNTVASAILVPYEVVFQGFTAELAAVLEGFYRSSNCFVVKNIDVQTNVVLAAAAEPAAPYPYMPYTMTAPPAPSGAPTAQQMNEMMRRRYGRYAMRPMLPEPTPTPTPAFAPPPRRGPETILDERPFKVTMYIEAVRLIERARTKSAK